MSEPHLEEMVGASARTSGNAGESGYDFAAAMSRYETPLLRYVGQILGRELARETEDLVQEAFLRLHRQIERHGESSVRNMSSWLGRVAHNLAVDAVRKRQRGARNRRKAAEHMALPGEPVADALNPLDNMIQRETCERVLAELHRLPEREEHVLLLRMTHGMTLREIGEVVGVSKSQVANCINRGLRTLSKRLKAAGVI